VMNEVLTNQIETDDMRIETAGDVQCIPGPHIATPAVIQMDENGFPVHDVVSSSAVVP
jgi:hypothetical protein